MSRRIELSHTNRLKTNDRVSSNTIGIQVDRNNRQYEESAEPVVGKLRAYIPAGMYEAVCYATSKGRCFGNRESIYINFRICGGLYDGTELFMACPSYKGFNERHKYYQQWVVATGRRPKRGEKLARMIFPGVVYRIKVRDTRRRFDDNELQPEMLQYSIVDRIVEPLTRDVID